jgi:hypothetical protein
MYTNSMQYHIRGISIFIPPQNSGYQLFLEEKLLLNFKGKMWKNPFQLIRQIANIALYRIEDGNKIIETHFDPPIVLWIGYDTDDLIQAGCDIDRLKFAYWDGNDWVIISLDLILPPTTSQVAQVTIQDWAGDPPLAWGG